MHYLEIDDTTHFGMTAIGDLQRSLRRAGMTPLGSRRARALGPRLLARTKLIRQYSRKLGHFFAPMMGLAEGSLFPYSLGMEFTPYCFDCWPIHYDWWERFFLRYKVRLAFLSIRASAEHFRSRIGCQTIWIPEAIDMTRYDSAAPLESREIDVLEFGRHYRWLRERIEQPLATNRFTYLHGPESYSHERPLFGDRISFASTLAKSKVTICVPRSMTHPDDHATAETITQRYLESMASGCLVYGHCPRELEDLFGYNPVVEMDSAEPAHQLLDLLKNVAQYQPLVARNLARMREVGCWDARVSEMILQIAKTSAAPLPL
jgi:hypothetical protein